MKKEKKIVGSYCSTFLKEEMRHIYRQVTALQKFETFVLTVNRQNSSQYPFADVERIPKFRSNFVRRFWQKYILKEPAIVYRGEYAVLNRILARRRADMMHIYFGHTGVHLLPFIERWPKPVVVSFHGMDVMTRDHQLGYSERLRKLLQVLPLVLVRSESLKDRLIKLGCPEEKIRINRTGIPLDAFPFVERTPPEDGAWNLVQACRLIPKKGLLTSLIAFADFHERYPKSRFTIAGEGPMKEELRAFTARLGIRHAVEFLGFLSQEDLFDLYARSHVFLHPSELPKDQNQEGVPNSMLEAMSTGLPVGATLHGGIPEAVENEVTGFLVEERDAEGLLQKLFTLTADADLWLRMGKQASQSVSENFSHQSQIEKLESFYEEALSRGK